MFLQKWRRKRLCNRALESVRANIPQELHQEVYDYIYRYDEWGVGMEMLATQISELEISIAPEQFKTIEAAMIAIGLGESGELKYLRDHNVVSSRSV